jgi:hypothetical protein
VKLDAVVTEPTSRRVSPAFFVIALACFFFTFAGVSCNTSVAKQTLSAASSLTGGAAQSAQLNSCLDSLQGVNLFSYSGINFVLGSAPSQLTTPPGPCGASQSSLGRSGSISSDAISVGVQPSALAGFIAIALAILWAVAGLLRRTSTRRHFLLLGGLGLIAFVTLVINQAHGPTVILDKVSNTAAGQGAPFSLTDFFVVNTGIAVYVAMAMVGIAFLHATAVTLLDRRSPAVVDGSQARAPD